MPGHPTAIQPTADPTATQPNATSPRPQRLTERPTQVGPYLIPKGVIVFPCLHVINNWSGNWGGDARAVRACVCLCGGGGRARVSPHPYLHPGRLPRILHPRTYSDLPTNTAKSPIKASKYQNIHQTTAPECTRNPAAPAAPQFKPERWLVAPGAPDPAVDPKSGAPRFLPFSSGPKVREVEIDRAL